MKILMLAQFFPPDVGGEERHVLNLSEALAARGHEISVATQLVPETVPAETLPSGVRVHRFPSSAMRIPGAYSDPLRPHHLPFPDPLMTGALGRLIERERPDVVHAHNWIVNSAVAVRRGARARRFGLVLTLHDYSNVCAMKRMMVGGQPCTGPRPAKCLACSVKHYGPLAGTVTAVATPVMRRWKERALDHIVSVSASVATRNSVGAGRVPSSVIPNFIPDHLVAEAAPGNPPAGLSDEIRALMAGEFIFFAGDLSRDKGIEPLLRAWAALGADRRPLLMVGRRQPETPTELPAGVHVAEKWPHAQVMAAFRRCTVAVLPSTWPDPCPTTVLEAMAAGRPVITTRTGGMVDMVEDGVSGLLVAPGDSAALAAAMRRVLTDEDLQERLGSGGRSRARHFTASVVADRLEHVYQGVVSA